MDSICISKSFYTFVIFIHETRDDGLKRGSFDKATLCPNNKKTCFLFLYVLLLWILFEMEIAS